jgi:thiopurine S-methyltransferase
MNGGVLMDANFWHQRWETNQIGFHESQANPLLTTYFKDLSIANGSRVFVPLCGKTLSIAWLLSEGYRVAGAELSELAIQQLFAELGIEPKITDMGAMKRYSGTDINIFVCDIFYLTH